MWTTIMFHGLCSIVLTEILNKLREMVKEKRHGQVSVWYSFFGKDEDDVV